MTTTPLSVPGPAGSPVLVAWDDDPGTSPRHDALLPYYREHGYVVARQLLPRDVVARVRAAFEAEVRPHRGPLFRQTTGRPELHELTPSGHVVNPLINVQDLVSSRFPEFKAAALGAITHANVAGAVEALVGERGTVIQTMCFEGNPATPAHQDAYYLDSTRRGSLVAAWIALEDIHPGAGRFFVYPGSQRVEIAENAGVFDVAFHHDRYLEAVVSALRDGGLECRAPALRAGDVLFWNVRTVHGSLVATEPTSSRFSLTAHFIPSSTGYLHLERRLVTLDVERINGVDVHRHRPQDKLVHRVTLFMGGRLPRAYSLAKRMYIRAAALNPAR